MANLQRAEFVTTTGASCWMDTDRVNLQFTGSVSFLAMAAMEDAALSATTSHPLLRTLILPIRMIARMKELVKTDIKSVPPVPESRANVNLEDPWTKTEDGRDFLCVDDGVDDRLLVFATTEMLEMLSEADIMFMDGTFFVTPTPDFPVISGSSTRTLDLAPTNTWRDFTMD